MTYCNLVLPLSCIGNICSQPLNIMTHTPAAPPGQDWSSRKKQQPFCASFSITTTKSKNKKTTPLPNGVKCGCNNYWGISYNPWPALLPSPTQYYRGYFVCFVWRYCNAETCDKSLPICMTPILHIFWFKAKLAIVPILVRLRRCRPCRCTVKRSVVSRIKTGLMASGKTHVSSTFSAGIVVIVVSDYSETRETPTGVGKGLLKPVSTYLAFVHNSIDDGYGATLPRIIISETENMSAQRTYGVSL